MAKIKFDYDEENDSLFIYKSDETVKGSVEIGDFVVDLNPNLNKIVGLEIINASKILKTSLSKDIDKMILSNIKKAFLGTQHKDNAIYLIYGIQFQIEKKIIKEQTMIPIPVASKIAA